MQPLAVGEKRRCALKRCVVKKLANLSSMDASQFSSSDPPDLYTDSVRVASTPYSFIFQFGVVTESPGEQKSVATIRMSPQHAWVLARILEHHLKEYEHNVAPIQLPSELLKDLGIDE